MLDEACPHHYCLKTLPINSPKFHIYESWKKKKQDKGKNVISKIPKFENLLWTAEETN